MLLAVLLVAMSAYGADRDVDLKQPSKSSTKTDVKTVTTTTVQKVETDTATEVKSNLTTVETDPVVEATEAVSSANSDWHVMASGGGMQSVGTLFLGSTIGQTAAGISTVGSYQLNSGFWQNWSESESCCVVRGDVNHAGDGFDISDIVYFVNWLFLSGPDPVCMEEADANASGGDADISDLVYLVAYIFQGGAAPVPCD